MDWNETCIKTLEIQCNLCKNINNNECKHWCNKNTRFCKQGRNESIKKLSKLTNPSNIDNPSQHWTNIGLGLEHWDWLGWLGTSYVPILAQLGINKVPGSQLCPNIGAAWHKKGSWFPTVSQYWRSLAYTRILVPDCVPILAQPGKTRTLVSDCVPILAQPGITMNLVSLIGTKLGQSRYPIKDVSSIFSLYIFIYIIHC